MRNFANFATFASANFVGKESNESTVMYQVKSRITPITDRKRNGNGTETDGNGTIDKDVFSLIKSRTQDTK